MFSYFIFSLFLRLCNVLRFWFVVSVAGAKYLKCNVTIQNLHPLATLYSWFRLRSPITSSFVFLISLYSLVPAKGGDPFGWKSNRRPAVVETNGSIYYRFMTKSQRADCQETGTEPVWCIIITQLFSIVTLRSWTGCSHFHDVFHSCLKTVLFSISIYPFSGSSAKVWSLVCSHWRW